MKTKYIISFVIVFAIALFCASPATYGGIAQGSLTNTKNGNNALQNNTTGTDNSAYGDSALFNNTTGTDNTAIGFSALYNNTTTNTNTAVGSQALFSNTTGFANAACGFGALSSNTTGFLNAAMGRTALFNNTTGRRNSAVGNGALYLNTTGNLNTADGHGALVNNTTGNQNIALGECAGRNIINGSSNIDIGYPSACDGSPQPTGPDESNTIRIGDPSTQSATFVAGIFGAVTTGGIPVYVDATGHLGTVPSSQRFKQAIAPMDKASEAILSLRPVTFRYKKEIDPKNIPQFGLVAEEVAKVNPDLVARDGKGEIYSVRYEAVNAMLLNEFIKEHRQVREQQKQIEKLTAQVNEQAALIQKVSERVELSESPRVVDNH
jgi:hypothetical protein